jgi:DNA-binding response OmpR family regulator
MTQSPPRILSISSDMSVFDTRNRVLESAGFEIVACYRGVGAIEKFTNEAIDAVVLGDSVPTSLRLSLLKAFRATKPSVPVMVMYPVGEVTEDVLLADAANASLDGPEKLIRTLSALVRKRPQGNAAAKAASNAV